MYKILGSLALMMILLLPGCVYTGFDASISVGTVGVNVNDGDGFCGYGEDEECHTVVVSLTNNGEDAVSTNMFYWEAQASSGGIFSAPGVIGPDACAGGSTCTITLNFDVTNGDTLTKLMWDDGRDSMETSITGY